MKLLECGPARYWQPSKSTSFAEFMGRYFLLGVGWYGRWSGGGGVGV